MGPDRDPSNAVEGIAEIDKSQSLATDDAPELMVDFSHPKVELINALVYMDGALTEDVIEEADIDEDTAEKYHELMEDDVWKDVEIDSEVDVEDIVEAGEEKAFNEKELQTVLEIEDRMEEADVDIEELALDGEMANTPYRVQQYVVAAYGVAVVAVIVVAFAVDTTP